MFETIHYVVIIVDTNVCYTLHLMSMRVAHCTLVFDVTSIVNADLLCVSSVHRNDSHAREHCNITYKYIERREYRYG